MPMVDHEGVILDFKAYIGDCSRNGKRSFGASELVEKLAELEVNHRLPEGQEGYDDRPLARTPAVVSRGDTSHGESAALAADAA